MIVIKKIKIKFRKFYLKLFWKISSGLMKFLPQKELEVISEISCLRQGKGWGMATISKEVSACIKLLKYDPIFLVDIGGHKGEYTEEFLKNFPELNCIIFEPALSDFKFLKQRFESNERVKIENLALSDFCGESILYLDSLDTSLSSLTRNKSKLWADQFKLKQAVNVERFDHYCKKNNFDNQIDILKIDVEGLELSILKGIGQYLNKIKLIQFEFSGANIETRSFFQDFWYFFLENNFIIYRITPKGPFLLKDYKIFDENFSVTNYVALNQNLINSNI